MSDTTTTRTAPAVWVGCLACYNNGRLTGEWVEATEASTYTPCTRADFGFPHEEWWVMDHEGFDGLLVGETSPSEAAELAELHATLTGEGIPVPAFAAWCDNQGEKYLEAADDLDRFRGAYLGEYESAEAWARDWLDEVGMFSELPEWAQSYQGELAGAFARDELAGGGIWNSGDYWFRQG